LADSERLSLEALRIHPAWGLADYNLALTRMLAGDNAAARLGFLRAFKEDPSLQPALLFAGVASHNLGDYGGAARHFKSYLALRPTDPQVHYYFGGTYVALGNYSAAVLEYLAQAALTPRRGAVYYDIAECYVTLAGKALADLPATPEGRRFRALAIAADKDTITGDFPEGILRLARDRMRAGDASGAAELLSHTVVRGESACPVLENWGDAMLLQGDAAGALGHYQAAMRLWPRCIEQPPAAMESLTPHLDALAAAAHAAAKTNVVDFEMPRLKGTSGSSARPCPGAVSPLARAACFASRGDLTKATAELALENVPSPTAAFVFWRFELYGELARAAAARLSDLKPDSYLLTEMNAESLELNGLPDQAEAEYRKATAAAGEDARPAIAYGRFECKLGKFSEALPILQAALRREPNNVEAHSLAAEALLRTDRQADAIPELRAVVNARPADVMARIDLANSLAKTGAVSDAAKLLEAAPADPDGRAHYVLARLYRQLGRTDDMKRALAYFQSHHQPAAAEP
jgi:tetratricopeptide (TPR) repeat protein